MESGYHLELKKSLEIATRIYHQKKKDKDKIYSFHEPEVECISKVKVKPIRDMNLVIRFP